MDHPFYSLYELYEHLTRIQWVIVLTITDNFSKLFIIFAITIFNLNRQITSSISIVTAFAVFHDNSFWIKSVLASLFTVIIKKLGWEDELLFLILSMAQNSATVIALLMAAIRCLNCRLMGTQEHDVKCDIVWTFADCCPGCVRRTGNRNSTSGRSGVLFNISFRVPLYFILLGDNNSRMRVFL